MEIGLTTKRKEKVTSLSIPIGIYNYANGDKYDGDWENGKMNGVGRCFKEMV